mmetsp:Transcript_28814/g.52162  ORF Transcript_28814/g.52162 Transcript_28814/m.52162 type:complete len:318 (-) Transcript_28814:1173-2126(-)
MTSKFFSLLLPATAVAWLDGDFSVVAAAAVAAAGLPFSPPREPLEEKRLLELVVWVWPVPPDIDLYCVCTNWERLFSTNFGEEDLAWKHNCSSRSPCSSPPSFRMSVSAPSLASLAPNEKSTSKGCNRNSRFLHWPIISFDGLRLPSSLVVASLKFPFLYAVSILSSTEIAILPLLFFSPFSLELRREGTKSSEIAVIPVQFFSLFSLEIRLVGTKSSNLMSPKLLLAIKFPEFFVCSNGKLSFLFEISFVLLTPSCPVPRSSSSSSSRSRRSPSSIFPCGRYTIGIVKGSARAPRPRRSPPPMELMAREARLVRST